VPFASARSSLPQRARALTAPLFAPLALARMRNAAIAAGALRRDRQTARADTGPRQRAARLAAAQARED